MQITGSEKQTLSTDYLLFFDKLYNRIIYARPNTSLLDLQCTQCPVAGDKAVCTTGSPTCPVMQIILEYDAGDAVPVFVYDDLSFNTWKEGKHSDAERQV
jgi:hypothetical protein